jgi:hypothetical protein
VTSSIGAKDLEMTPFCSTVEDEESTREATRIVGAPPPMTCTDPRGGGEESGEIGEGDDHVTTDLDPR